MPQPKSKKSENLEVRISHSVKKELHEKAASENQTVSDIIRALIEDYLGGSASQAPVLKDSKLTQSLRALARKPAIIASSILAAVAMGIFAIPTATASNITLKFEGDFVHSNTNNRGAISNRTVSTEIEFDQTALKTGELYELPLPVDHLSGFPESLALQIVLDEAKLQNGNSGVMIKIRLIERQGEAENILAEPTLTVLLNEQAQFFSETEIGDSINLKFTPSRS